MGNIQACDFLDICLISNMLTCLINMLWQIYLNNMHFVWIGKPVKIHKNTHYDIMRILPIALNEKKIYYTEKKIAK